MERHKEGGSSYRGAVIETSPSAAGNSENLLAELADHLVKPGPMIARITYASSQVAGREEAPRSEGDYEFVIFGGNPGEWTETTINRPVCLWRCDIDGNSSRRALAFKPRELCLTIVQPFQQRVQLD